MRPSQYILLAAMPVFISGFEQSLMATSAGSIAELAGVQNAMAFILAAYFLAASVTTLIFGRLGDAFGPMRMLVVALLIYVMGSLLASQANGFAWLIGARFIQGVGGGGMIALPQAFLAQRIAPRQRAAYQGYLVAVAFFANTFGPVFGGLLISHFGWQSVFIAQLPMGASAAWLIWASRNRSAPPRPPLNLKFDWLGTVMLVLTMSCVLHLMKNLSEQNLPPTTLALAAALPLLALAFVFVERRAPDALIPGSLFVNPIVWRSGLIAFLYGALFTGMSSFLPILFRTFYQLPFERVGFMMMPFLGAVGVGSILTGQMVRMSGRTMIFPALGLSAVGAIIFLFALFFPQMTVLQAALCTGLVGLFMGSTLGVVQISIQIGSPMDLVGRSTAFVQLSRTIGSSLGAGLGMLIYVRSGHVLTALLEPTLTGSMTIDQSRTFSILFSFFACLAVIAGLVARSCNIPALDNQIHQAETE